MFPGVAIATALMPPICTAGYGLANGNMHFFVGALYLFLLNSVLISIATLLIVRYLNFPFVSFVDKQTEKKVKRYIIVFSSIIIIPSAYLFFEVTQESIFYARADKFTKETFIYKGSEVINNKFIYDKEGSVIEIFMIGKHVPDEVIWAWEQELKSTDLKKTTLKIIQNNDNSDELVGSIGAKVKTGIIEELYQKNYVDLKSKNAQIDSLKKEIRLVKEKQIDWGQLKKEIFIQYPELENLSFGESIQISLNQIDTIPTLIPLWIGEDKSIQLKNWLEVRLNESEIRIIPSN